MSLKEFKNKMCTCYNKDEDYFLFLTPSDSCDKIVMYFITTECKGIKRIWSYDLSSGADILKEIKEQICNYKFGGNGKQLIGAILSLFDLKDVKNGYLFRQLMKALCVDDLQIPYQFVNVSTIILSSTLFAANITVENSYDMVTVVHVTATNIVFTDLRKKNNAFMIEHKISADFNSTAEQLQHFAMSRNPSKIILTFSDPLKADVQKYRIIFKSDKTMVLYNSFSKYVFDLFLAMINDLHGIETNKFKVSPIFNFDIFVSKQQIAESHIGCFVVKCEKSRALPFSETVNIYITKDEKVCVYIKDFDDYQCIETIELPNLSSSYATLTLSVDVNSFYTLSILPQKKPVITLRAPHSGKNMAIEFSENGISLSVPGIGFIKDENGNSSISYFVSFLNDPVKVGESAKADIDQNPSFVVYDLLEILKMATSKIHQKPEWKFQVRKDSIGFLQIIFDTWRGKRKATPHFLIAIIVNHLFKLAVEKIGFRTKDVDFRFTVNMKWMKNAMDKISEILKVKYDF